MAPLEMGAFLTQIAGQFAKPFFMSALLPVVIVLCLFVAITYPLFPGAFVQPAGVDQIAAEWRAAWNSLAVIVAAMLLYVLNSSIVRFFSGYPWRSYFPGTLMAWWRRRRFRALSARRDAIAAIADSLEEAKGDAARVERLRRSIAAVAHRLNGDFPYGDHLVLPTRLGNVIRNAEDYARVQYGVSAVPLWPRLLGAIPADYTAILAEARTSFDFAINTLFLLWMAAAGTVALAIVAHGDRGVSTAAAVRVVVFLVLADLTYRMTIVRARTWGEHLKAAVDLYRRPLMEKLGYKYEFVDMPDEKDRLWSRLTREWEFPDMEPETAPFQPPKPPAPAPLPSAETSAETKLEVARGVSHPSGKPYALLTVRLQVVNAGPHPSTKIRVVDSGVDGWTYVWDSAANTAGGIAVTATHPHPAFEIDPLAVGGSAIVSYQLRALVP